MISVERPVPTIRPVRSDDIVAILALDKKFTRGKGRLGYADINSLNLGGPTDLSFVAEIGDELVGFLLARLLYLMIPFIEACVIQGILVDPDYQRQGIGGKLTEGLIEHCSAEHINLVRALVPQYDKNLRVFLQTKGFAPSNILNYDKSIEGT